MFWFLLATALAADPFSAWQDRIAKHLAAHGGAPTPVPGASDLDGDGNAERWVLHGCRGVALESGDRWFWVFGGGGEFHPLDERFRGRQPGWNCTFMGDDAATMLRLQDGAPDIAALDVSAHHGNIWFADSVAGTWAGRPYFRDKYTDTPAHWVNRGTKDVAVGGGTIRLERVPAGVLVTGLGTNTTLVGRVDAERRLELRRAKDGSAIVTVSQDGAPYDVRPGAQSVLVTGGVVGIRTHGGDVAVAAHRTVSVSWAEGSATAPPGPWDDEPLHQRPQLPSPKPLTALASLQQAHPDWDSRRVEVGDAVLTGDRDGTTRLSGPAGAFEFGWKTVSDQPPRVTVLRNGEVLGSR